MLVLSTVIVTACGASRGLRVEPANTPVDQLGGDTVLGTTRVISGTAVFGQPGSITSDGNTVWASLTDPSRLVIQAIDSNAAQERGIVFAQLLPQAEGTFSRQIALASTPGKIWILVRPGQGQSLLQYFATRQEPARSAARFVSPEQQTRLLRNPAVHFPNDTRLVGATESTLWLVSRTGHGYTLWRYETPASKLTGTALASVGSPGVAVTSRRVFVLLQDRLRRTVVVQTRDSSGKIMMQSSPLRIEGTFQPGPLGSCGGRIFGWTRNWRGDAVLFRVDADSSSLTYSASLPPATRPATLKAIAFSDHCQSIWIATYSYGGPGVFVVAGAVSRLQASSLKVTGQINDVLADALLWTRESLWASDGRHGTVLRIR
jgi:hypothetical protein